jgi:lipoprotein NlpI
MCRRVDCLNIIVFTAFAVFCNGANADGIDDALAGIAAVKRGDYDDSIRLFTLAIESRDLSVKELANVFVGRGRAWDGKKDYDRAVADYTEAIRLNPRFALAFYNRAIAWRDKKDYDRAVADYTEVIRLNPQYANAFKGRGRTQFFQAKFSSAVPDFAQAQRLNADAYTALWLYLARSRVADGDGKAELTLNTNDLDEKKWPAPVAALYLGKAAPGTVTIKAADPDAETDQAQRCEANFYIGEWHLLRGEMPQARTLFTEAQNSCPETFIEYAGAAAELERLK